MAENRSVVVEGRHVEYLDAGAGGSVPLVLLHGGGFDHAGLSWAPAFARLRHRRRVLVPDLPGYGGSAGFGGPHDLARLSDWLGAFLDATGVGCADLAGVSMGGGMALLHALDHPDRVRRVVGVGAYGLSGRLPLYPVVRRAARAGGLGLAYSLAGRARVCAYIGLRAAYGLGSVRDETVTELMDVARDQTRRRSFDDFLSMELTPSGLRTDLRSRLGRMDRPTLLVHGARDPIVPIRYARAAVRRLPKGRLVELPAGHWPMRQCPDPFVSAVERFLAAP